MTVKINRFARYTTLLALTSALLFPAIRPSLAEGSAAGSGGAIPPILCQTTTYIYYADGTVLFADGVILAPTQNVDSTGTHFRPIL
jgi:hypothetical protein